MAKVRPASYYNTVHDIITSRNFDKQRRVSDISEHSKMLGFTQKNKEEANQNQNR